MEQRRGLLRTRLELRVELSRDEERMLGKFDDLDQTLVRRSAGNTESRVLELLAQRNRHLVAMAMTLVDHGLAVDLAGTSPIMQLHGIGTEDRKRTRLNSSH